MAELCRRSYYDFFLEFWDEVNTEPLVPNWHIKYLCDQLQAVVFRLRDRLPTEGDIIVNIPPGSSKSNICTILLPAWAWAVDPTLRVLSSSYSDILATEHAVKSRDIIMSAKFKEYFSSIQIRRDKNNKTNYENQFGGQRIVSSVGGTATGMHAHLLIVDDPINPKRAQSEPERQSANEYMTQTLSTRKVDKAVSTTILVMQRLHTKDPTGEMLKRKKVKHYCFPAELSQDTSPEEVKAFYQNGLLDPNRMPKSVLDNMKVDLGSYGYSGQMQQRPTPEGGGILKSTWLTLIDHKPPGKVDFFIDGAFTDKTYNDPTAILVTMEHRKDVYITNSITKHLELYELVKYIKDLARATPDFGPSSLIHIEEKASGLGIKSLLRKEGFNVVAVDPKFVAEGKIARAYATAPAMEAGRVKCVKGQWNEIFFQEIDAFPNGENDDQVDNLTAAVNRYTKPGLIYM